MNPLQRASVTRKVIYFAAIVVLFTFSMVWRGMIPVPLGASTARAAQPFRWANNHTIQNQAERLEVWEVDPNESEAEVSGSAARLALTGSRGFVVTALWLSAIEKQKRNDFHEFEQRVGMVTKLQPNFITPWIFQSWNIAYNVSVEMHASGDMYYYIVRGIQLLAEGEKRNRRSPDVRYQLAFYYQNKFGVSDQVETLRCLFDLSCMPPGDRNPARFYTTSEAGVKEFNYEAFRHFCQKHPHFVRRLRGEGGVQGVNLEDRQAREKLRADKPEEVVAFLEAHYKELPCRYRKDAKGDWTNELADPEPDRYFPVLPPKFAEGPDEAHPAIATPDEYAQDVAGYFSGFKAARAWFAYSLVLLPPPLKDEQGDPIPGPTPPPGVGGHDPSKHRVPRLPMMIIFRQGAPRAQTYCAELEQKEGWFDGSGWDVGDWFPSEFAAKNGPVVVGTGRAWSYEEWRRAASMWERHGKDYALSIDSPGYKRCLQILQESQNLPPVANPDQPDEAARRRFVAQAAQQYFQTNRQVTNFGYFLSSAKAEAWTVGGEPRTVLARKALWQAEQARKRGEPLKAIRLYQDGLRRWKDVLLNNPEYHRLPPPDRSDRAEEEAYEFELAYLRLLVAQDERVRDRADQIANAAHAVVPFLTQPFKGGAADPLWPTANKEEIKWFVVENVGDADFSSPFVGSRMPDGSPWIREEVKEAVRQKQGVARGAKPPQQSPPGAPQPQPGAGGTGG